jgi:hypothetical protein
VFELGSYTLYAADFFSLNQGRLLMNGFALIRQRCIKGFNALAMFSAGLLSLSGLLLSTVAQQAQAFGPTGHRVVARVAENHLNSTAKQEIENLLKGQNLTEIATWVADKSAVEDSDFWKRASTHWHYVNVPAGEPYRKSLASKEGDAYVALETFIRTLKSPKASPRKKAFALKFITHIIGDIHQPIQPLVDKDGDQIEMEVEWMGQDTELSFVWEQGLLDHQRLSFTEIAAFADTQDDQAIKKYQTKAPIEWIEESLDLRSKIIKAKPETLDEKYALQYFPVVKGQLRKAGIRLAGVLNEIFPEPEAKPQGFDAQLEQQASSLGKVR